MVRWNKVDLISDKGIFIIITSSIFEIVYKKVVYIIISVKCQVF